MRKIELPYFGEINLTEDYFEIEFTNSNKQEISITIDFEGEELENYNFDTIRLFLKDIENNIEQIKNKLLKSEFSKQVIEYIEYHMSESKTKIININSAEEFIQMHPKNINIYPTAEERFFSIDFTIDEKLTNDLLVVDLYENNSISYVTTES